MKISLLTDAPKHNLALMKLSAHFKANGDEVLLNMPVFSAEYRLASVLFEKNIKLFSADEYGGPAFKRTLPPPTEKLKPDYDLYPHNDFSLGYTFRGCFRKCRFCKVPKIETDFNHYSIWDFHDPKFKKICLLNNNTFFDKQWKKTFEEIWDADLTVIDENGYDLRLLDPEKAAALKKTKFHKDLLGFAWDRMEDESAVMAGLKAAKAHGLTGHNTNIYMLCGYDTTEEDDLYRAQIIGKEYDCRPFVMPYTENAIRFKRFIDTFMWRKYKTIKEAWKDYK